MTSPEGLKANPYKRTHRRDDWHARRIGRMSSAVPVECVAVVHLRLLIDIAHPKRLLRDAPNFGWRALYK